MVAWGGVGLFGAGLGRLARHELGRLPLAAACGVAGLGFGAVMNLSTWVTFSGDHTTAKLIATFGSSLPFDIAHATGNVLFYLAFGPALVRALRRFRTRFDIIWLSVEPVEESRYARSGTSAAPRATHAAHGPEGRIASAGGPRHGRLHQIGRTDHSSTNSHPMSRPEPYSACWTLADHVDRAAALWPESDALVFGGVRRTFEQFADATFEFARALAALGVGEGDTVGVLLPIGIPALTALYGAARLGAIGVPLDPALRSAQLRDVTRHAGLKVLIAGAGRQAPGRAAARALRPAGNGPAGAGGADAGRGRAQGAARGRALGHRADHVHARGLAARLPAGQRRADPLGADPRRAALPDRGRRPPVQPAPARGPRVAAAVQRLPRGRRDVLRYVAVRRGRGGADRRRRALHGRVSRRSTRCGRRSSTSSRAATSRICGWSPSTAARSCCSRPRRGFPRPRRSRCTARPRRAG